MKPVAPEGANLTLGRPAGWDEDVDGPCDTIAALRTTDDHNNLIIQTCWQPDAEELAALSAGAQVVLSVWGVSHPPVSVGVAPAPVKSS